MSVRISRGVLEEVLTHVASDPAREVCGLLFAAPPFALSLSKGCLSSEVKEGRAGLRQAQPERIKGLTRTLNVAASLADRFEIDPAALFAAIRAERAGGPALIGHYHSHPGGSPQPSACDAAMADRPGRLWLIVAGREALLWREEPDGAVQGAFAPVELIVEDIE